MKTKDNYIEYVGLLKQLIEIQDRTLKTEEAVNVLQREKIERLEKAAINTNPRAAAVFHLSRLDKQSRVRATTLKENNTLKFNFKLFYEVIEKESEVYHEHI